MCLVEYRSLLDALHQGDPMYQPHCTYCVMCHALWHLSRWNKYQKHRIFTKKLPLPHHWILTCPLNHLNNIRFIFLGFENLEKVISFMILSNFGFVCKKKKHFWQNEIITEIYYVTPKPHNSSSLNYLFKNHVKSILGNMVM